MCRAISCALSHLIFLTSPGSRLKEQNLPKHSCVALLTHNLGSWDLSTEDSRLHKEKSVLKTWPLLLKEQTYGVQLWRPLSAARYLHSVFVFSVLEAGKVQNQVQVNSVSFESCILRREQCRVLTQCKEAKEVKGA